MSKTPAEILSDAQQFYVAKGYGTLPDPVTSLSLASNEQFGAFYERYATAFKYYEGNYPDAIISSHLSGIDFNRPVELVVIPSGQNHTQTQVAWGPKGNYYSTSENTPEMMGIAPQGKMFDPGFVPPFMRPAHDARIEELRSKMAAAITPGETHEQAFPPLPERTRATISTPITNKSIKTYAASENITALKSSAKEIEDTWSVPGKKIQCKGGGAQLYVSHKENEKMKQVDFGVHDEPEEVRYLKPN